jgi:hypothetical protein
MRLFSTFLLLPKSRMSGGDSATRPSYAAYEFAVQLHKNFIDDKLKKKVYKKHKDASAKLVEKICDGMKKSSFTKRAIKDGYDSTLRAVERRKKDNKNR